MSMEFDGYLPASTAGEQVRDYSGPLIELERLCRRASQLAAAGMFDSAIAQFEVTGELLEKIVAGMEAARSRRK